MRCRFIIFGMMFVAGCANVEKKEIQTQNSVISNKIINPSEIKETIEVATVREFLDAIQSNRIIKLNPGCYSLDEFAYNEQKYSDHVLFKDCDRPQGAELVLRNINNVRIIGMGKTNVNFTTPCGGANVLNLINCSNVEVINLRMGHSPQPGWCSGNVINVQDSKNILIENCDLFGCGVTGLSAKSAKNIILRNSSIHDCSGCILTLEDTQNVSVIDSIMYKNEILGSFFYIKDSQDILFTNCQISDNGRDGNIDPMFYIPSSVNTEIIGGIISGNHSGYLDEPRVTVKLKDVILKNNKFIRLKPVIHRKQVIIKKTDKLPPPWSPGDTWNFSY